MQAIANKPTGTPGSITQDENIGFSSSDLIFPTGHVDGPKIRYGYAISTMNFLVPEGVVSELIQKPAVYSLPNAPSWISGLINIRGNIIPVMNIEKLLKIKSTNKLNNILIFNKADNFNALAVVIEGLPILLEHSDKIIKEFNYPDVLSEYIDSGFTQNDVGWAEFNPQKLFKNLAGKN